MSTIDEVKNVHAEAIARVYKARPDYLKALVQGRVVGVKGDPREAAYLVFRVLDAVNIDLYELADALTARAAALQRSDDSRLGFWVAMGEDEDVIHAMAWMRLAERREMLNSILPDFQGVYVGVALPVEGAAIVSRRRHGDIPADVRSLANEVAYATRTIAGERLRMRDELRRLHDVAYALHEESQGTVTDVWSQGQFQLLVSFRLPMGLPRLVKPWELAAIPDIPERQREHAVYELYTRFALIDRTHGAARGLQAEIWDYLIDGLEPDDEETEEVPRT